MSDTNKETDNESKAIKDEAARRTQEATDGLIDEITERISTSRLKILEDATTLDAFMATVPDAIDPGISAVLVALFIETLATQTALIATIASTVTCSEEFQRSVVTEVLTELEAEAAKS